MSDQVPERSQSRPLRIAMIAGESSGDHLGAGLMEAMQADADRTISFAGVGGPEMERAGLTSVFPLSEIAVMGPFAILARLPGLIRRVHEAVDHVVAFEPDILIIVDSPEFTHQVAKRVRRRLPRLPIVDYVSPTVWAWRPWRARKMRAYIDRVLAVFPFEPAVHRRLGGPDCVYVGHPAVERLALMPGRAAQAGGKPTLLVLPGSRITEVERLMPVFRDTLKALRDKGRDFDPVLPAVAHLADRLSQEVADWPVRPRVVSGEFEKWNAFSAGRVALAASGTVTLELALAGVPMVVTYRLDPLTAALRWMVRTHSVVMANLVIGENAFPEYIHKGCDPQTLSDAVDPLFDDGPERRRQLAAIDKVRDATLIDGDNPSRKAAAVVLDVLEKNGRGALAPRP
ncbi:lipid-A-disaccharide synthase [Microbaculum marinisediminis]|uniref:Lipid-A-disaccharide synthase n=1 Tax=Microbaculum marinisediminis TaxID=2931392 RepID=A0AAW5R3F7_9HYPH|nr:lipid-A-disaccharide synthase [Microbaculum sp. A6E488]MCT8974364.1 lipid-A-disaccharide synthase [Microbaculum sp. A6E488]